MPYTNIDLYNTPSENPPASNYNFFRQAYFELYNATYNNTSWVKPSHLRSMADAESYEGRYALGILDYEFNMIDSNAINNGTLTFNNGQFYDVPGSVSPYWLRRAQIASILTEQIPSGIANLTYNTNFIKTNLSVQVSSVLLNFGSIGNFTLSPSNSVVPINFTGSGKKDFTITVNYSNGSSFTNSSQIQLAAVRDLIMRGLII